MISKVLVALLPITLLGCTKQPDVTMDENSSDFTDSIEFAEMDLLIKFSDPGLFDTSFVFTQYVGFCGFGTDFSKNFIQPRFSNTAYNNNDSSRFGTEPPRDSLLYLNFFWQRLEDSQYEVLERTKSKLDIENSYRIATKRNPFSNSFFYETNYYDLELVIFGAETAIEGGRTNEVKLEVAAINDTIVMTAYFQYMGNKTHSYLKDFCSIAKTMRVEKSSR